MKTQTNIRILIIASALLMYLNCKDVSPRQQCYEDKCKKALATCYLQSNFLFGSVFGSGSTTTTATTSATSISQTETFTTGTTNDTFSGAESKDIPSGLASSYLQTYNLSGGMSSGTDVDIFYYGFFFSTSLPGEYDISQTAGSATCVLYTTTSFPSLFSSTPDSTFTLVGTASTSITKVKLRGSGYLWRRCSGASGATYTIKTVLSAEYIAADKALSASAAAESAGATSRLAFLTCSNSETLCRKTCDEKNQF